ncbi:MAG TPA: insulinase family protein, partial [Myxococcaceae bacterium]|nr:insulinase family protein [Myxococcaceae bacterium]
MKRFAVAAWGTLLLTASAVWSQEPVATPTAPPGPSIPFEKYVLRNGLEVILHTDRRLPVTAVSVWYHVGALNETPGRTGFAHLFEHMMFQG